MKGVLASMQLWIYFRNRETEQWCGPEKVEDESKIELMIDRHRYDYNKYMLKKSSENGDEIIACEEMELPVEKIRKRRK